MQHSISALYAGLGGPTKVLIVVALLLLAAALLALGAVEPTEARLRARS